MRTCSSIWPSGHRSGGSPASRPGGFRKGTLPNKDIPSLQEAPRAKAAPQMQSLCSGPHAPEVANPRLPSAPAPLALTLTIPAGSCSPRGRPGAAPRRRRRRRPGRSRGAGRPLAGEEERAGRAQGRGLGRQRDVGWGVLEGLRSRFGGWRADTWGCWGRAKGPCKWAQPHHVVPPVPDPASGTTGWPQVTTRSRADTDSLS